MNGGLSASLVDAINRVEVDVGLCRAAVDDREVSAGDHRQLRTALAAALYDLWHAGRAQLAGPKLRRDPALERALQAVVPHDTTTVSAPLDGGITATEAGAESVTVRLGRVRVRIPAGLLTTGAPAVPGSAVSVRLPALRPALSPGFLVVSGSRGSGPPDTPCLRVYFHIDTPDAAPTVWGAILVRLEELGVTYRAKVVSARQLYPRRDAMVVYLRAPSWAAVPAIQHAAKATGALGTDVSAYVAHIDSGVGWAWDPEDPRPGMGGMSFGEHRSHAIATGILAAATGNGTGDREAAVGAALCAAGIRPGEIHRNIDSPDWSEISSLNDAEGR